MSGKPYQTHFLRGIKLFSGDCMSLLSADIALAEKHCQQQGQRLTKKRKVVLLALLQSRKAISAYELVEYCKIHFNETITAMSVYRILDFLQMMKLAHKLNLANKYIACSHIVCEHSPEILQFLICEQCQHVEEISIDASTLKGIQAVINKTGFHLNTPQLEINGICNNCSSS